jgi:hypothetical protein
MPSAARVSALMSCASGEKSESCARKPRLKTDMPNTRKSVCGSFSQSAARCSAPARARRRGGRSRKRKLRRPRSKPIVRRQRDCARKRISSRKSAASGFLLRQRRARPKRRRKGRSAHVARSAPMRLRRRPRARRPHQRVCQRAEKRNAISARTRSLRRTICPRWSMSLSMPR